MYCVYLITEKLTQSKLIHIFDGEKTVFIEYSPRLFHIELLEKHQDKFIAGNRIEPLRKLYKCPVKTFLDKKEVSPLRNPLRKPLKPGPKPGTKFKITDEDRERRRKQFSKELHPNANGLTEEHKQKISATKKTQPSNFTGKKHTEESKRKIAEKKIGNKHREGWTFCFNPITGEEKVIRVTDKIPEGYRLGRSKSTADNFNKY
jgi:hypothetical protein